MYFMAGSVSSLARYCLFSSTQSVKVIFAKYEKALHYCCKGMCSRDAVFIIQNKIFTYIIQYVPFFGLPIFTYTNTTSLLWMDLIVKIFHINRLQNTQNFHQNYSMYSFTVLAVMKH